jgi:hypothetical protein
MSFIFMKHIAVLSILNLLFSENGQELNWKFSLAINSPLKVIKDPRSILMEEGLAHICHCIEESVENDET